jgi:hypothetical protein
VALACYGLLMENLLNHTVIAVPFYFIGGAALVGALIFACFAAGIFIWFMVEQVPIWIGDAVYLTFTFILRRLRAST